MDIEGINRKIEQLDVEIKDKEQHQRLLDLKRNYTGDDEIITAKEFQKSAKKEQTLYKAFSSLRSLDKIIDGFRPGTLVIVSGPTKQGKTTFCQTLTKAFIDQKFGVLWFSFDTPPIELIERFPDVPNFFLPRRSAPDKKVDWIEAKIIEGIAKFNTRIIFLDHLGFLTRYTDKSNNYATELTSIVRDLKDIAMRWNVTIFLNHHIRSIGAEEVPNWSHLKDSSGPAQDSDITLLIYRARKKTQYGIEYDDSGFISVQLHRRTGKTGTIRVGFKDNLFTEDGKDYGTQPF